MSVVVINDHEKKHEEIVFGIDPGAKRVGLAVGNTLTRTAQPLAVFRADVFFDELPRYVREWQPARFAVGLPVNTVGQKTQGTRSAQRLGRRLMQDFHLPIIWVDERYSSVEAQRQVTDAKSMKMLDAYAATIILQQYLDAFSFIEP